VGRSDALGIFIKWQEEQVLLRCQGSFPTHAFAFEGRITALRDNEIRISDGQMRELVVRLTNDLAFSYADSREVTGKEAMDYPSCVVVMFGEIPLTGDPDTIAFAEVSPLRES
jgi:hypothetical protein